MKKILFLISILICTTLTMKSQELNIQETINYINNILPIIAETRNSLNGKILNTRIECDNFGNVVVKCNIVYEDDISSNKDVTNTFSLKEANIIWVGETHYSNGNFAGYQLRFEKSKYTVPIYTISINNKEMGDKVAKAFMHLRKITKIDPFK